MDAIRPLSTKVTQETWMFIGMIFLVVICASMLHTRFTQQEYYTMRQRVQIQSLLAHATRNVANGTSLQEALTIFDAMHRIISEEHAKKIFNTDLTKLYEKTQMIMARKAMNGGPAVGAAASSSSKSNRHATLPALPPLPIPKHSSSSSSGSGSGSGSGPSSSKKASPILDAIMKH